MFMDYHQYQSMSVEQLASIRDYGLEKVHQVTEALRARVREDYAAGVSVKKLARQCGVTRATIYSWISDLK